MYVLFYFLLGKLVNLYLHALGANYTNNYIFQIKILEFACSLRIAPEGGSNAPSVSCQTPIKNKKKKIILFTHKAPRLF